MNTAIINENDMQHGFDWNGEYIEGWIASEKLDGCRAYWDGRNMWSRGGIRVRIPEAWRADLPAGIPLDGEIYDGVDGLSRCIAAVRYGRFSPSMRFVAFDAPDRSEVYTERMKFVRSLRRGIVGAVVPFRVAGMTDCLAALRAVIGRRGEGLVLRKNGTRYAPGRTRDILKAKRAMFERVNG